jgi:hypothetical protein
MTVTTNDAFQKLRKLRNDAKQLQEVTKSLEEQMWRAICNLESLCESLAVDLPNNVIELNPPEPPKDYAPLTSPTRGTMTEDVE